MYESRHQALAHPQVFRRRVARHALVTLAVLAFSLGLGIAGYMAFEGLSCIDAFVDAAMLLGGMGPVHTPVTFAGKLFAGAYALFAGLVFIACATLAVSPFAHRLLHRFHWNENER
jgi:hypothetical protein